MDVRHAVTQFVAQGRDLYRQLHSEGEHLTNVELVMLRVQLHILDTEAIRLQGQHQLKSPKGLHDR
ncbi:MAG TPA: hypothetical protein VH681_07700 [Nitrospiraceae bacterium]|jgi:hypothetical protein